METVETRPGWPSWYGFAALGLSLVLAVFAGAAIFAVVKAAGSHVKTTSPGVTIAATLIQDALLVGSSLWLASRIAPPRPWQFGLRPTGFWRGFRWAAAAVGIYLLVASIYVAIVNPKQSQTTLQDLGAGNGIVLTVVIGILVVGVAPVAEEFFFRGFFYTALRTRFPFLAAALIDSIVFGLVHAPTGIEAVPPLIALGFGFCLAYERTGSIVPGIALHALNNMIAFGSDKQGSWAAGACVAGAVLAGCLTIPRRAARRPRAATG